MAATVRAVDYFYVMVKDRPGEACRLLSQLAAAHIDLLAFSAIPAGPLLTQLVIFPNSAENLARAAENTGLTLSGSQRAFLIQGDDQLGSLVDVHQKLCDAGINVVSSSGVADGRGGYGYVLYVRPEEYDKASSILGC
jgi:hypothetical protein